MDTSNADAPPARGDSFSAAARTFLDLARRGRNGFWRYFLTLNLIFTGWFGFGVLLYVALVAYVVLDGDPTTSFDAENGQVGGAPLATFAALMLGFAGLLVTLLAVVRFAHRRPVLTLVTPLPRVDFRRVAVGFLFFLALSALASAVEAALHPGRYRLTFDAVQFLRFLPLALALVPLQTTAEELFFRGYLAQTTGLLSRFVWPAVVAPNLVFALLHMANPEAGAGALRLAATYFVLGVAFSLVALRDGRLELAVGAHTANNLQAVVFANYAGSAVPTPAVFTASVLDANYALASAVAVSALFYAGLFARRRPHPPGTASE